MRRSKYKHSWEIRENEETPEVTEGASEMFTNGRLRTQTPLGCLPTGLPHLTQALHCDGRPASSPSLRKLITISSDYRSLPWC